jgi:hypothetical protein
MPWNNKFHVNSGSLYNSPFTWYQPGFPTTNAYTDYQQFFAPYPEINYIFGVCYISSNTSVWTDYTNNRVWIGNFDYTRGLDYIVHQSSQATVSMYVVVNSTPPVFEKQRHIFRAQGGGIWEKYLTGYSLIANTTHSGSSVVKIFEDNIFPSTGTIFKIEVLYDRTSGNFQEVRYNGDYVNGSYKATATGNFAMDWLTLGFGETYLSSTYFDGIIDEVRISDTWRPRNWSITEYNNENQPQTFFKFNIEQLVTPSTIGNSLGVMYYRRQGYKYWK